MVEASRNPAARTWRPPLASIRGNRQTRGKSLSHPTITPRDTICTYTPFGQGVRQDVEAHVPNADCFYVAFDAASNATMGMGKVALQEFNARDPTGYFPRYDTRHRLLLRVERQRTLMM